MTPEERAAKLRERLEEYSCEQLWGTAYYPEVEGIIAAAIRDAVAEEREACARMWDEAADGMEADYEPEAMVAWLRRQAAAVRARGEAT